LLALLFAFAGSIGIRTGFGLGTGLQPLQQLLAANEPEEHVRAAAPSPDGLWVATEKGLLGSRGLGRWSRVEGISGPFHTATAAGERLYLGGPNGLFRWEGGALTKLAPAPVHEVPRLIAASPAAPDRLIGWTPGSVWLSTDGGKAWAPWSEAPGMNVFSLAVHPQDPSQVWLGGSGSVAYSTDGGKTWQRSTDLAGDVTAIVADPRQPDLVWALAGGRLWTSLTGGTTWTRAPQRHPDRTFVALVLSPHPDLGLVGITADGFVAPHLNDPARSISFENPMENLLEMRCFG
jgi:hypothetical protein